MKKILIVIVFSLCSLYSYSQISTFDSTAEGWTYAGDAKNLTHLLTGGMPDGNIRAQDKGQGITWYWVAPANYLGNKIASIGNYFRFDLKTNLVNSGPVRDVIFEGHGLTLYYTLPVSPNSSWTNYNILIDTAGNWVKDSSGIYVAPSYNDFINVFDSLSRIWIRAEYSSTVGDYGYLDNVMLEPYLGFTPQINIASSDSTLCDKTSVNFYDLSTNNPTNWQWYFPGATPDTSTLQNPLNIYYSSSGTFDVTLIACNSFGCDSITYYNFITEFQPSTPTITQWNDTLFSSPGLSYQWYDLSGVITGATNWYYDLSSPGTYYVIVTDSNGCDGVSNVITITSVESINSPSSIHFFPSPVKTQLSLSFDPYIVSSSTLKIFDILGNIIHEQNVSGQAELNIDVSQFVNGVYFILLANDKGLTTLRFIKE